MGKAGGYGEERTNEGEGWGAEGVHGGAQG